MDTRHAYNHWSEIYDTVINKTRDLEAEAIRSVLKGIQVNEILELGCGTGKNTSWLAAKCVHLIAADFSTNMLQRAKEKITDNHVSFCEADITKPWPFPAVDLVTCSLVLEHISDLDFIFTQAAEKLRTGGRFYICELHPYRQLQGSMARFEKDGQFIQPENYLHHLSEYFLAATAAGFIIDALDEWFDSPDKSRPPRLISFLFRKK